MKFLRLSGTRRKRKELVLHIGAHKTGTTTIQMALFQNQDALNAQGVTYVRTGHLPNLHSVLGFARDDFEFVPDGFALLDPDTFREALSAATTDRVIASSENFSFFTDPARIDELAEVVEPLFSKIKIVTYLRRQDSHVVSHHQEGAKPNRLAEERLFGYDTTAMPHSARNLDLYLDYETRIGRWMDRFGDENVEVRIFDRAKLAGRDVWPDFLETVGLDSTGMRAIEEQNTSFGLSKSKVGHLMNQRGLRTSLKHDVLEAVPDDSRQLPSRQEAEAFYEKYRDGNIALKRRMGATDGSDLFQVDFSSYSDEPRELWSEDQANAAIGGLLDALNTQDRQSPGADRMRDLALNAEAAGELELALKLMEVAAWLRPEGPLINQKLEEYRAALATQAEEAPSPPLE